LKSRQLRGTESPRSITPRDAARQTGLGPGRKASQGAAARRSRKAAGDASSTLPAPGRTGGGKPAPAPERAGSTGVAVVEVPEDRAGQRLDNLLLGLLKGVPKSHIYRLLRTGQVRVDGRRAKADHRVAAGERLRIPPLRMAEREAAPRAPDRALATLAECIVDEDRRFIALNKPSGLASHGGSGISLGAIEQLRQLRPRDELELVHRLDRDTSGVLLIAKQRSALRAAQLAIREGRARKRYLALLVGHMPKAVMRVDAPLVKSVLRGGERLVEVSPAGKPARSEFRRIEQYPGHEFVEVLIDTGRTHQIRVHARHLGLPVAGDPKYGDQDANAALRGLGLRRLFLHGAELRLDLGSEGEYAFHAPLPEDLSTVLTRLGERKPGQSSARAPERSVGTGQSTPISATRRATRSSPRR